jgi:hypothetical protein
LRLDEDLGVCDRRLEFQQERFALGVVWMRLDRNPGGSKEIVQQQTAAGLRCLTSHHPVKPMDTREVTAHTMPSTV